MQASFLSEYEYIIFVSKQTIISRAFDARLGTFGTFFMFVKKKRFYQKAVGFNVLFIFQTLQKLVISKDYSVLL